MTSSITCRPTCTYRSDAEAAYHGGIQRLTDIFLDCVVENIEDRLRTGDRTRALKSARLLWTKSPAW